MKYRTGFVTNSSSTSFGAEALTVGATLLSLFASLCGDNQDPEQGDEGYLATTVIPEGVSSIKCEGKDPVWVYAQFIVTTKDGEKLDSAATAAITFTAASDADWVYVGPAQPTGDWQCADVLGINPGISGAVCPKEVKIKASTTYNNKSYSKTFTFSYEAPPSLAIAPTEIKMLSGSGDEFKVKYEVQNPGADPWSISVTSDTWADKICESDKQEDTENVNKGLIVITESDSEDVDNAKLANYYTSGVITVKATSGDKEFSTDIKVTVFREGLFLDSVLDEERNFVYLHAETDDAGKMKVARFSLVLFKWDTEQHTLVSDAETLYGNWVLKDFVGEDSDFKKVLGVTSLDVHSKGIGTGDKTIKPVHFEASVGKVIPGDKDDEYPIGLLIGSGEYEVTVPLVVLPARAPADAGWETEYNYCKYTIEKYVPDSVKGEKLRKLETDKYAMGADELRMYRHECWIIARDALMKEYRDYKEAADLWDKRLYYAENVKWMADQCFSVTASLAFGPLGAFISGQVYDTLCDIIQVSIDKWDKDWYTLGCEILWKRAGGFSGKAIDAKAFSNPTFSIKWISLYATYKVLWHWYWDFDGANRKGFTKAVKATGADLVGQAFKTNMKSFLKDAADKGGIALNKDTEIGKDFFESCLLSIADALTELQIVITF